jgi:hypothetical protein
MPGSLLLELSSEESSDEEHELSSYFLAFLLNLSGTMFNFLALLLYKSSHHWSCQLVYPPSAFLPRPKLSSLRLSCTHSVDPSWFLPRPLPSYQPICFMIFLAY